MFKHITMVFCAYAVALSVWPLAAAAADRTEVDQAIAAAEKELAAVAEAGHVWRLIDKSTGSRSENLDKILAAAKKARDEGNLDEALRIAKRVESAAKLGQAQATDQRDAKPFYPAN